MAVPSVTAQRGSPHNRRQAVYVERKVLNTTSTAAAGALSWINPTGAPILASVTVRWSTAGTGTIDVGVSDDGTGSDATVIDGGTLTGVVTANRSAGTVGGTAWYLLTASGTSGDSIVGQMSDTTTSTAVGTAVIQYVMA